MENLHCSANIFTVITCTPCHMLLYTNIKVIFVKVMQIAFQIKIFIYDPLEIKFLFLILYLEPTAIS